MTNGHLIRTAAAAAHLALVACGAASVLPPGSGRVGTAVRWYGEVTEAGNGYAYFAPSVGSPTRVSFTLTDDAGRTETDALDEGGSAETRVRVGTVVLRAADPELRSGLAAAWAAAMFAKHPDARRVLVRIEAHDLPTMSAYRAGTAPGWGTIYEATFRRAGERQ
jgi:hypothetical protein